MLNDIGVEAKPPKAGLYIWAKVPEGYTSIEFTNDLLDNLGIVITPGTGYGTHGEGYVRLSLTFGCQSGKNYPVYRRGKKQR